MADKNILSDIAAAIIRLTAENTDFETKNGFLAANVILNGERTEYERVFLHRAFPFQLKWEYISVLDAESNEIGVIFELKDFGEETQKLLKNELERKYYEPHIKSVQSLKERYGFSYWNVETSDGRNVSFTMQDTFRNIIRIGEDKAILLDVDGNRFVIESISSLDRKSYRKIEIYL